MKKFLLYLVVFVATFLSAFWVNKTCFAAEKELPEIYIKAINPGYSVDGTSNVGEMIEIATTSDAPVLLAGLSIGYTNSSGNFATLVEFPEHSWMVGENFLLRLASSPGHELAALNYTKTLAFKAGPLEIRRGEEVIDSVCWTGKNECLTEFKAANPTTLVRNLETGEFEHLENYEPIYHEENYRVEGRGEEAETLPSQCKGLMFSEILSYYDNSQTEQFVEFYNSSSEQILLDGCLLKYKNKTYPLAGIVKPEGYFVRYLEDFSITKNPTNFNTLEIVDTGGEIVDKIDYKNGQRKGASYAWVGYDSAGEEIWRVTYVPTPGEPNNYQEYKTCEEGKVLNKETGNCVKVATVTEKVCKDGYYLNFLTGRCNKIKTVTTKTCKEGYMLNEETGRCVKIKENTGANYELKTEEYEENSSFVALYIVLGVVIVGVIYVVWEFRKDLLKFWRKVFQRVRQKLHRGAGRH